MALAAVLSAEWAGWGIHQARPGLLIRHLPTADCSSYLSEVTIAISKVHWVPLRLEFLLDILPCS